MPDWQPIWDDVAFDHGAATAAVDECERAARQVREAAHERGRLAAQARDGWVGPARSSFDRAVAQLQRRSEQVEHELRAAAASIRSAADRARAEQAHRTADRARWQREAAAEQAAPTTVIPTP